MIDLGLATIFKSSKIFRTTSSGELYLLGIRFNQVSIINMIMATGLAVDYTVYFVQKFMVVSADGTLNGRMKLAMADTGSAVFIGGVTALLGSIPMAASK